MVGAKGAWRCVSCSNGDGVDILRDDERCGLSLGDKALSRRIAQYVDST